MMRPKDSKGKEKRKKNMRGYNKFRKIKTMNYKGSDNIIYQNWKKNFKCFNHN